jgi:outer membrane protein W
MQRASITAVIGIVVCTLALPVTAGERGWHVRVFAAGFDPDLDVIVPAEDPDEIRVTADSDLGFGGSVEFRFTDLLGLELGAMQGNPDVVLTGEIPGYGPLELRDSMSTLVTTLDLDLHLTPGSAWIDVFVGAGVANVAFSDLHYVDPEGDPFDLSVKDDFTYSAKVGLDIAFGRTSDWFACAGLRYLWSDIEATQAGDPTSESATFDFDLLHFTVGVGYSF